MPFTAGEQEYLNQAEALEFLDTTFATFKSIQERYSLKAYRFATKARQIFYLKSDLERIRDTPEEIKPEEE